MSRLRFPQCLLKATALALAFLPASVIAAPNIVVSLKPLELLVRAVATEDTAVTTLVGPGSNPHNYSMKPSQRRALSEADAIFWVGPEMETFLTRLLNDGEFQPRSHAFLPGDTKDGHNESEEAHPDQSHSHSHDHHDHSAGEDGADDPHIWLDPESSLEMARDIHAVLAALPDADKATLDANLKRFEQSIADVEKEINQQLEPARALSLFTYHNAFTHFAAHYNLPLAGVLTLNPELSPGARHIAEVQDRLGNATRPCLMTERPFNQESWAPIIGDIAVNFTDWDPLASDIKADADGYVAFQRSLADAVLECL
jgi:zinc transport system substrate-binding protein